MKTTSLTDARTQLSEYVEDVVTTHEGEAVGIDALNADLQTRRQHDEG